MQELVPIVFLLAVLGFALYLIERFIPMVEPFKIVIRFVVIVGVLVWLWNRYGGWHMLPR